MLKRFIYLLGLIVLMGCPNNGSPIDQNIEVRIAPPGKVELSQIHESYNHNRYWAKWELDGKVRDSFDGRFPDEFEVRWPGEAKKGLLSIRSSNKFCISFERSLANGRVMEVGVECARWWREDSGEGIFLKPWRLEKEFKR